MFSYLFQKQKGRFILYSLFVIIASVLEVALAYVMSLCVELAMNKELSQFTRYGVMFIAYVVLVSLSDYLVKYQRAGVLRNAQTELRNDTTKQLLAMDSASFHDRNTGDWVSLLANDVDLVGQSYFNTILLLFPDILSFTFSLVCVFYISWPVALFVLVLTVVQLLIPKLLSPSISQSDEREMGECEISCEILKYAVKGIILWIFQCGVCRAVFLRGCPGCNRAYDGRRSDRCCSAQRVYHLAFADVQRRSGRDHQFKEDHWEAGGT